MPSDARAELETLAGRTAVVVGACGGIGASTCERLGSLGMTVIGLDLDPRPADGIAELLAVDVRNPSEVSHAAEHVASRWGAPWLLVNGAGITRDRPAIDVSDQDWQDIVGTGLAGTFYCCRAFGRLQIEAGGGRVVNVASQLAFAGRSGFAPYAAAKGGVVSLTRALAVEWAESNVLVNALAPGPTATAMNAHLRNDPDKLHWLESLIPLHRIAAPSEIADWVAVLASPIGNFMTGQVLMVDGGYTAW